MLEAEGLTHRTSIVQPIIDTCHSTSEGNMHACAPRMHQIPQDSQNFIFESDDVTNDGLCRRLTPQEALLDLMITFQTVCAGSETRTEEHAVDVRVFQRHVARTDDDERSGGAVAGGGIARGRRDHPQLPGRCQDPGKCYHVT